MLLYRNRIKFSERIGKYAEQCQKHMKYDMILADNAMKAILKKIGCDQQLYIKSRDVHMKTTEGKKLIAGLKKMTRLGMLRYKAKILKETMPELPELSKERAYELLKLRMTCEINVLDNLRMVELQAKVLGP